MAVAPWTVSDELWERVEPLLPKGVGAAARDLAVGAAGR